MTSPRPSMFGGRVSSRHDVRLLELELGRVLDRDDALVVRDERREAVEQRRLAGAGAAGDEDVQPGPDHARAAATTISGVSEPTRTRSSTVSGRPAEAADREHRAVERQRRDDRVHARAVRQAGVDHRRALVDAAADARHDAVDDLQQVRVVAEDHRRRLELADALDVDLARRVDQDVRDLGVAHERLDRAEAAGPRAGSRRSAVSRSRWLERDGLLLDQLRDRPLAARPSRWSMIHAAEGVEIDALEQLAMDAELQLLVRAVDLASSDRAVRTRCARGPSAVPRGPVSGSRPRPMRSRSFMTLGPPSRTCAGTMAAPRFRGGADPASLVATSSPTAMPSGGLPAVERRARVHRLARGGLVARDDEQRLLAERPRGVLQARPGRATSSVTTSSMRSNGDVQALEQLEAAACASHAGDGQVGEEEDAVGLLEGGERRPGDGARRVDDRVAELRAQQPQRQLDLVVSDASASSICCGAGRTKRPLGMAGERACEEDLVDLAGGGGDRRDRVERLRFRKVATSPRWRSRSASATPDRR